MNRVIICSKPGESGVIPYLGAIWALENNLILSHIKVWIIPSVTSIIAILIICGFKCVEITAILINNPELLISPIPFKDPTNFGLSLDNVKSKINRLILSKLNTVPTLKEIKNNYGITIIGVGFSLQKQKMEYLHYNTHPNITILDLICISLSTPGIYLPYLIENTHWIDGSLIDPFPIESISVDCKIIAITTSQTLLPLQNYTENISRSLFEYKRSILPKLENTTFINIEYDVKNDISNSVSNKIKIGYDQAIAIFSDTVKEEKNSVSIQEIPKNEAEEQD
jgi:hypothetical protein